MGDVNHAEQRSARMARNDLKEMAARLTPEEREKMLTILVDAVAQDAAARPEGWVPERCPRCGCEHVTKRGKAPDGTQAWQCHGCGRSFTQKTCSVTGMSKLPAEKWARYCACMVDGVSLREAARRVGVSLKTSYFMRHRLMELMESMLPPFAAGAGCAVEADEVLVPDSLSGNHRGNPNFPCPAGRGAGASTGSSAA